MHWGYYKGKVNFRNLPRGNRCVLLYYRKSLVRLGREKSEDGRYGGGVKREEKCEISLSV